MQHKYCLIQQHRNSSFLSKESIFSMKIPSKFLSFFLASVLFFTTLIPSTAMADESNQTPTCQTPMYCQEQQQIFILSLLSNAVVGIADTQPNLQNDFTSKVTNALKDSTVQEYIGKWDVVWGPAVYQANALDADFATNSMFVAKNQENNEYVVAMAGTNPVSVYDWFVEDFDVSNQVPFDAFTKEPLPSSCDKVTIPASKNGTNISKGTCEGLLTLLTMPDPTTNQHLKTFLEGEIGQNPSNVKLIFTGHSLGGALSPALALAINELEDGKWSDIISVYPSAGPTSGNQGFSDYYDKTLGNQTTRIWNKIDVVPHAWEENLIAEVSTLYPELDIKTISGKDTNGPGILACTLIGLAEKNAENGDYTQIRPDVKGLPGQYKQNPSLIPSKDNDSTSESISISSVDEIDGVSLKTLDSLLTDIKELIDLPQQGCPNVSKTRLGIEVTDPYKEGKNFYDFMNEVAYQHLNEYNNLLGVEDLSSHLVTNNYVNFGSLPTLGEIVTTISNKIQEEKK